MSKCQKDSGSMFGCVPVCDREATVRVTVQHCGSVGTLTYLSCDRHRHMFGTWPDVSTIEPLTERHTCGLRADGFAADSDVYCPACLAVSA